MAAPSHGGPDPPSLCLIYIADLKTIQQYTGNQINW